MKIQRDGKEYTLTAEEVMEAHEEFVTSFMVAELENSYDVPHKYSKDLAKEAYDMYADSSIYEIEDMDILKLDPFVKFGKPARIASLFGGRDGYIRAVRELENEIYKAA